MRSIVLYLSAAKDAEVAALLSRLYPAQQGPPWVCEVDGDACLYINFQKVGSGEVDWPAIKIELGHLPTVSLRADVSGRHIYTEAVYSFVSSILRKFEGRALDENSDHCWTLGEIVSKVPFDGRPFFHCPGWKEV